MAGAGMQILGVLMGLLSAFTLAVSMNVQEYALAAPEDQKLIKRFGRNGLWVSGLLLYLVAQGFFVAALSMASQTLVSALFAYCLIFDAAISHYVLGIEQSKGAKMGLAIIMTSLTLCGLFSPVCEYELPVTTLEKFLFHYPTGAFWLVATPFLGVLMAWALNFEKCYPLFGSLLEEQMDELEHHVKGAEHPTEKQLVEGLRQKHSIAIAMHTGGVFEHDWKRKAVPPRKIEIRAMIVFPLVLGTIEMFGQSTLKSMMGMLQHVTAEHVSKHPLFLIMIVLWASCAANVVIWLKKVYGKFETTQCLPIEYGSNTVFCIASGLIFFREYQYCSPLQFSMIGVSCCGIFCGIYVMMIEQFDDSTKKEASEKEMADFENQRENRIRRQTARNGQMIRMSMPNIQLHPLARHEEALGAIKKKAARTLTAIHGGAEEMAEEVSHAAHVTASASARLVHKSAHEVEKAAHEVLVVAHQGVEAVGHAAMAVGHEVEALGVAGISVVRDHIEAVEEKVGITKKENSAGEPGSDAVDGVEAVEGKVESRTVEPESDLVEAGQKIMV
jgi:MFS family permease